jgi:hypothetical protein
MIILGRTPYVKKEAPTDVGASGGTLQQEYLQEVNLQILKKLSL